MVQSSSCGFLLHKDCVERWLQQKHVCDSCQQDLLETGEEGTCKLVVEVMKRFHSERHVELHGTRMLASLLADEEEANGWVRDAGSCGVLGAILRRDNVDTELVAEVCEAMALMSADSETSQMQYLGAGACTSICTALARSRDDATLSEAGMQAAGVLATGSIKGQTELLDAGIADIIHETTTRFPKVSMEDTFGTPLNPCLTVADCCPASMRMTSPCLTMTLMYCVCQSMTLHMQACGAVASLSDKNTRAQDALGEAGVCEAVVKAMTAFPAEDELQLRSMKAVANLSCHHMANQERLGAAGACVAVVRAMTASPKDEDLQQQGCRAIASLADYCSANQQRLGEAGACKRVWAVINAFSRAEETTLQACRAVVALARDCERNRKELRAAGTVRGVVEALGRFTADPPMLCDLLTAATTIVGGELWNQQEFCRIEGVRVVVDVMASYACNRDIVIKSHGALAVLNGSFLGARMKFDQRVRACEVIIDNLQRFSEDTDAQRYGIMALRNLIGDNKAPSALSLPTHILKALNLAVVKVDAELALQAGGGLCALLSELDIERLKDAGVAESVKAIFRTFQADARVMKMTLRFVEVLVGANDISTTLGEAGVCECVLKVMNEFAEDAETQRRGLSAVFGLTMDSTLAQQSTRGQDGYNAIAVLLTRFIKDREVQLLAWNLIYTCGCPDGALFSAETKKGLAGSAMATLTMYSHDEEVVNVVAAAVDVLLGDADIRGTLGATELVKTLQQMLAPPCVSQEPDVQHRLVDVILRLARSDNATDVRVEALRALYGLRDAESMGVLESYMSATTAMSDSVYCVTVEALSVFVASAVLLEGLRLAEALLQMDSESNQEGLGAAGACGAIVSVLQREYEDDITVLALEVLAALAEDHEGNHARFREASACDALLKRVELTDTGNRGASQSDVPADDHSLQGHVRATWKSVLTLAADDPVHQSLFAGAGMAQMACLRLLERYPACEDAQVMGLQLLITLWAEQSSAAEDVRADAVQLAAASMQRFPSSGGLHVLGLGLLDALQVTQVDLNVAKAMVLSMGVLQSDPLEVSLVCAMVRRMTKARGADAAKIFMDARTHNSIVKAMACHPYDRAVQHKGASALAALAHASHSAPRPEVSVLRRALVRGGAGNALCRVASAYIDEEPLLIQALTGLVSIVGSGGDDVVLDSLAAEGLTRVITAILERDAASRKVQLLTFVLLASVVARLAKYREMLGDGGACELVAQEKWLMDEEISVQWCRAIAGLGNGQSQNQSALGRAGAPVLLCKLLHDDLKADVTADALRAASMLIFHHPANQQLLRDAGGLQAVTKVLCVRIDDVRCVTHACTLLQTLSWRSVDLQAQLGELGACEVLVRAMLRHTSCADVQVNGTAAIAWLASIEPNRARFSKTGACKLVCDAAASSPLQALRAIGNLTTPGPSSAINRDQLGEAGACKVVATVLATCVGSANGADEATSSANEEHTVDDGLIAFTLWTIANITRQHPLNSKRMGSEGVPAMVVHAITTPTDIASPVQSNAWNAIMGLAVSSRDNKGALMQAGVLNKVAEAMSVDQGKLDQHGGKLLEKLEAIVKCLDPKSALWTMIRERMAARRIPKSKTSRELDMSDAGFLDEPSPEMGEDSDSNKDNGDYNGIDPFTVTTTIPLLSITSSSFLMKPVGCSFRDSMEDDTVT